jgi:hypothetical protein
VWGSLFYELAANEKQFFIRKVQKIINKGFANAEPVNNWIGRFGL